MERACGVGVGQAGGIVTPTPAAARGGWRAGPPALPHPRSQSTSQRAWSACQSEPPGTSSITSRISERSTQAPGRGEGGGGGGDDARCRRGGGWPRSSGRHVPLTAKSVGSGARTRPRPHALRNCTRHSCWHCRRMSDSLTSASVPDFAASSRLSTLMATGVPSGSSPSYTWGGGGPGRSREGLVRGGAARGTAT